MHFYQVAVTAAREDADTICDWLDDEGALSVTIESANDQACFDEAIPGNPSWEYQKLTALFDSESPLEKLNAQLAELPVIDPPILTKLENQDWERIWLAQFEPVRVNDKLWICPSWIEPPNIDAVNLKIDPGLAFGTGNHPTTLLILKYLADSELESIDIIDYGCGSGILGIAGLALGARRAICVDVDPKAIQAAKQNAQINSVESSIEIMTNHQFRQRYPAARADLVLANILAGTLISLNRRLINLVSESGVIVLSGILESQALQVESAFKSDFDLHRLQLKEWIVLIGKKQTR